MEKKDATISKQEIVSSIVVNGPTFAENAKDQILSQNVNCVLKLDAWEYELRHHPDTTFRNFIIDGIINGVNIGHNGDSHRTNLVNNWPSAKKHHDAVTAVIHRDLSRGRKVGPYHTPPENFVSSPLGAFEKKRTKGKYRVIHDLSWPPGQSVNESISMLDCSVYYVTIDDIVDRVKSFGVRGVKMSKLDLEDAYKHIFVRMEDRHLLGLVWDIQTLDGNVHREYFMDTTLPFGLKSSAMLFNKYADALQYVMINNGATIVEHYLDDYFTCGAPTSMECEVNLVITSYVCKLLGFGL